MQLIKFDAEIKYFLYAINSSNVDINMTIDIK
jgi:hypothetical protein